MAKYKLKEGIVLEPFGDRSSITNENLTDVIAAHLLSHGRATIEDFETIDEEAFPTAADAGGDSKNPAEEITKTETTVTGSAPAVDAKGDQNKSKPTAADAGGDSKK